MNIERLLSVLFLSLFLISSSYAQDQNILAGERQALVDLFNSTSGPQWNNNNGWLVGNPSNSWYGVKVDENGRVVFLNLRGNNLSGFLPESLGNLTKLRYFNVKQNQLTGEIPWAGIGNWRNLTHLLLNGRGVDPDPRAKSQHPGKDTKGSWSDKRTNNFIGGIGPEIGNLINLKQLELMGLNSKHVGLTGPIPPEIGNLRKLEGLFLDYNSLNDLPNSMGNLTNLVHFSITSNSLDGRGIPSWIANWSRLKYLWLGENNLGGPIPDLSNLNYLQILILRKNNLEGEIPPYLFDGTMPKINMVNLSFNNLKGKIPEFSTRNNLKALQLSGNHLTGPIPKSIANLPNMINLSLGWNAFEGEIPNMSHMHHLRYVRVNNNNLTGSLPLVDTSNSELQFLHFQDNRLSGNIPVELTKLFLLPNFEDLNISNNNFSDADIQPLMKIFNTDHSSKVLKYHSEKAAIDTAKVSGAPAQLDGQ